MSEAAIIERADGSAILCDDEGNRDWFPSVAAAQRVAPDAIVRYAGE